MTVSVSVLSHAFLTGKGISGASLPSGSHNLCSDAVVQQDSSDPRAELKAECVACGCRQSGDIVYTMAVTPRMQSTGCCSCREYAASPSSMIDATPSPRPLTASPRVLTASPSPRQLSTATPSPRTAAGKSQGKKKAHKKRGARKRAQESESKEAKGMQVAMPTILNRGMEGVQTGARTCGGTERCVDTVVEGTPIGACEYFGSQGTAGAVQDTQACSCHITGGNADAPMEVDVALHDIREECSSALGIVKEDLELFGLYHVPRVSERASLPKDKSGLVHLGVMVRNSDRLQVSEKAQEFNVLKLKYDKLTQEVLRLRTMVNRANHLRRESEKATEMLRGEFEKLVQTLFMDCSSQTLEEPQPIKEAGNIQPTNDIVNIET